MVKSKTEVRVYSGKDGIKKVVEKFSREQNRDTIRSFGYEGGFDRVLGKNWWKTVRTNSNTKFAGLFSSHAGESKPHSGRAKIRYIKAGKGSIEVAIWKDTVRIFSLSGKNPSVVVIKNSDIAKGFMNYWKFLWQQGRKAKRKL